MGKEITLLPKITIVTPNYNLGEYLEETICSIISQNYPNLEYIIIDGGSKDNSIDIIKKYEEHLTYWVSEPDNGMYHAIQKGFDKSTGEIMGWLNSDDMLHPNSLWNIANIFTKYPHIKWLQGQPTLFDKQGNLSHIVSIRRWQQFHFYIRYYQWIQQESTYWRRSLWKESDGTLNLSIQLAADFELWSRFFDYTPLYCTNILIGGFRQSGSQQLSNKFANVYQEEVEQIIDKKWNNISLKYRIKLRFIYLLYIPIRLISRFSKSIGLTLDNCAARIIGGKTLLYYNKKTNNFTLK